MINLTVQNNGQSNLAKGDITRILKNSILGEGEIVGRQR